MKMQILATFTGSNFDKQARRKAEGIYDCEVEIPSAYAFIQKTPAALKAANTYLARLSDENKADLNSVNVRSPYDLDSVNERTVAGISFYYRDGTFIEATAPRNDSVMRLAQKLMHARALYESAFVAGSQGEGWDGNGYYSLTPDDAAHSVGEDDNERYILSILITDRNWNDAGDWAECMTQNRIIDYPPYKVGEDELSDEGDEIATSLPFRPSDFFISEVEKTNPEAAHRLRTLPIDSAPDDE